MDSLEQSRRNSLAPTEPPPAQVENDAKDNNPLTLDVIQSSLDVLTHNAMGYLVYARCTLSSMHLTSIKPLGMYKHLQRISLNDNELDSLKPLQELTCLVYLSAANNKLTNEVFDDLAPSGSTLEKLNLSQNKLATLEGLQQLPFLVDFRAEENQLTELEDKSFSLLHSLTRLNLRSNQIQHVHLNTFSACGTVRHLNLSHNELENAQFVMHLADNLEILELDHNKIKSLTGLDVLHELVDLKLEHNRIESWKELETLAGLINLRYLTIEGNPILEVIDQAPDRKQVIGHLESKVAQDIDFIDGRACGESRSFTGSRSINGILPCMVSPCAGSLLHETPMILRRVEEWEDDGSCELAELSPSERDRFRVISILQQLFTLDSIPVHPHEIPRALRLFKRKNGGRCAVGSNIVPVGSAAKAVESQRVKRNAQSTE